MKFKLFILCLINCSFITTVFSQDYQYVYYFDKDLNSCKKADAIVNGKGFWDGKLFKLDYFVNQTGLLLMSVHYTDSTLNIPNGPFKSYYINTRLEKEGNYDNGLMQGLWQQWDDRGFKTDSSIYEKDYKIRYATFRHYNKDKKLSSYTFTDSLSSYTFTDSLQNTFEEKHFSEKGIVLSEVHFFGQRGLLKTYDSTGVIEKADSVFTREEIEAGFPGGQAGWNNFLKKNLNGDVPTDNGAKEGTYTVVVRFKINKDGTLSDIETETNNGYGIEKEAIRIIKISPKWIPAKQYGRFVNAYRRQPITFLVQIAR